MSHSSLSRDGSIYADLRELILAVALPTRAEVPIGTLSRVGLVPLTALADPAGATTAIEPEADEIKFAPAELLFEDEDLFEWELD